MPNIIAALKYCPEALAIYHTIKKFGRAHNLLQNQSIYIFIQGSYLLNEQNTMFGRPTNQVGRRNRQRQMMSILL